MVNLFGSAAVDSAIPLPSLPSFKDSHAAPGAVVVEQGECAVLPQPRQGWIHHWRGHDNAIVLSLAKDSGGAYLLRAPNLADFLLKPAESRIEVRAVEPQDPDTLEHLLVDQVLPRFLAYRGKLLTHASAVVVGGRGVLILGPSGAGKSTLAGLMTSHGHTLHSDDCVELAFAGDGVHAMATYPSLRLLPDALAALHPQGVETRKMAHYSRKARVSQAPSGDMTKPFRLHAAYFLGTVSALSDAVHIRPLSPATACIGLVRHSFQLDPTDMAHMRAHLQACAAASLGFPSFALDYPRDFTRSAELVEHVVQHVQGLLPNT